jgi:hypothetical protein
VGNLVEDSFRFSVFSFQFSAGFAALWAGAGFLPAPGFKTMFTPKTICNIKWLYYSFDAHAQGKNT